MAVTQSGELDGCEMTENKAMTSSHGGELPQSIYSRQTMRQLPHLVAERDLLAAQVAACSDLLRDVWGELGKSERPWSQELCDRIDGAIAALPAAAARFLAADKVANNYMHLKDCPDDGAGAYSLTFALDENLDAYRAALAGGE